MSAELKKLAEAAQAASYWWPKDILVNILVEYASHDSDQHHADAAYIAAASPDAIIKLIAERDALYKALKALLADIESYQTINLLNGYNNLTQVNARAALALAGGGE